MWFFGFGLNGGGDGYLKGIFFCVIKFLLAVEFYAITVIMVIR